MTARALHRVSVVPAGRLRLALIVLGVAVLALVLLALARLVGGRDLPSSRVRAVAIRASHPAFEATLAAYTRTNIESGNAVTLALDGDGTFPALWRDMRAARRTIVVQQYFARPGAVADTLAAILAERARAGVSVRVLLDGHGASAMPASWGDGLRGAGAAFGVLRPLRWQTLYRVGNRSHIRVVVIDDAVGYSGGIGFADTWLGNGRTHDQWRETNVRVEGPAVAQLRSLFAIAWFEATDELLPGPVVAPPSPRVRAAGDVRAGVFYTAATTGHTAAAPFLALAIGSAEHRLYIASSYFVPDAELRAQLIDAARRGVDVRVLTAGRNTDVRLARFAGRHTYGELLRGGVRVYEYEPTMMHAKTLVVDGIWCAIGSMNLDTRSTTFNDEANVIAFDRGLSARLDSVFVADLALAQELTLARFGQRGLATRFVEWLATFASRML